MKEFSFPVDPSVEQLLREDRAAIARHWTRRADSEMRVGHAFDALVPRLEAMNAPKVVTTLVASAAADEQRHSGICSRLAALYGGDPLEASQLVRAPLPEFGTDDERMEVSLLVLGLSCINESIACEWIRSCYHISSAPIAIAATRFHLQDEMDHARFGWAYMASETVSPAMRGELRRWVSRMVDVNVAEWKRGNTHIPEGGIAAHGHLSVIEHDAAIDRAIRDVVRPGLRQVGLL